MTKMLRLILALAPTVLLATTVAANPLDTLKGKFTFNWTSSPSKQKCRPVDEALMTQFKSPKFKCDLTIISNTASGQKAQVCEEVVKGKAPGREYLIFASMKACEDERKTQASNGP